MVNRIEKMKKEWEMAVDTLSLIRWQNSKRIWQKKKYRGKILKEYCKMDVNYQMETFKRVKKMNLSKT